MTKYLLEDREQNYHDDSDFYAIFYDSEKNEIRSEMYGTTRCAAPRVAPTDEYIREIPQEFKPRIFEIVYKRAFEEIKRSDRLAIDEPEKISIGDSVTLLEKVSFKDKRSEEKKIVTAEAGESAVVIWEGAFGTFYRNGYNRKGRSNTRVGLRFEDGRVVFTSLEKCKLSRVYLTDEEIEERAKRYASNSPYVALFGMSGGLFVM